MPTLDRQSLPSWSEIFLRIGEREPHRGRARCPLHNGNSPYSFSVNEGKGIFHCFVCHAAGDKFDFMQRYLHCDFKDALRWFGLEPGKPPKPDPIHTQAQTIRENLQAWKKRVGREARDSLLARHALEVCAIEQLRTDAEDDTGWRLLAAALQGFDRDEYIADAVDLADEHDDLELLGLYREFGQDPHVES